MGKRKAPVNDQDPSSIDEIFASSSKAQASSSSSKTSKRPHTDSHRAAKGGATTVNGSKKKKRRPEIDASDPRDDDEVDGVHGEKRKRKGIEALVETVVDPSTLKKPEKEGRKRSKKDIAEDEAFRDSRGTSMCASSSSSPPC